MSAPTTSPATAPGAATPRPVLAGVADAACVVAFATIGRGSHAEGLTLPGIAVTAWPFLAGAAAGWLLARAWRRPAALPTGAVVWVAAVAGGMALRAVSGQGTALSFVVVTTVVLGALLVGWRALARLTARRRAR